MSGASALAEASVLAAANAQRGPRSALAIGHNTAIQRKRAGDLAKTDFPHDYMDVGGRAMQEQLPSISC